MKQRTRIYYTQTQKALMWERWKQGDSLQQIAQLFDRNHLVGFAAGSIQEDGVRYRKQTLSTTAVSRWNVSRVAQSNPSIGWEIGHGRNCKAVR